MWRGPRGYTRQVVREWADLCNFLKPSRSLGGEDPLGVPDGNPEGSDII